MKSKSIRIAFISILFMVACSPVYWEKERIYKGSSLVPVPQKLEIGSEPPAEVWMDGRYMGETPLEVTCTYYEHRVDLVKHKYEGAGPDKKILEKEETSETIVQPILHTFAFRKKGYGDRFLPLTIPYPQTKILVSMDQTSLIPNLEIEARFTIRAPETRFPFIRKILTGRKESGIKVSAGREYALPDPGMKAQSYTVHTDHFHRLDDYIGPLFTEAGKRNIVFDGKPIRVEGAWSTIPDREFRGVWVSYLDWPGKERTAEGQKKKLVHMLDRFKESEINAVFFQVRIEGDALYRSPVEPWSRLLTGIQGMDPGYDPLAFAVSEAHKRGIELHAWVNPYRMALSGNCRNKGAGFARNHLLHTRPEWILKFRISKNGGCYRMLDPGIPEVTDYLTAVVSDIVNGYDVDGIHFDDRFYPYPEKNFPGVDQEDVNTYGKYAEKRISIENFRRRNINRMLRRINLKIKSIDPNVRFGVSPFGIWKKGVPKGMEGMGGYDAIYGDALAWLEQGSIDYLSPQLYWKTGGPCDYTRLLKWWAEKGRETGRHVYPGQMLYYVDKEGRNTGIDKPESAEEVFEQLRINRENRDGSLRGTVFYRAFNKDDFLLGSDSFLKVLNTKLYASPALPPIMDRLPQNRPDPPGDAEIVRTKNGMTILKWKAPLKKAHYKYAVRLVCRKDHEDNDNAPGTLLAVTGETEFPFSNTGIPNRGDLLFVTAVSRNNVESEPCLPVVFPDQ